MIDMPSINETEQTQEINPLEDINLESDILTVIKTLESEDRTVRERLIRVWKRNNHYWRGIQRLFWDDVAGDWRDLTFASQMDPESDLNPAEYAYTINIYKAHGESIIAALSVGVPNIRWFPEDAENAIDLTTADTFNDIYELISIHNQAKLLLIKLLFTYFNEGLCAIYNYSQSDMEFGFRVKPVYETIDKVRELLLCPSCGSDVSGSVVDEVGGLPLAECPTCGEFGNPVQEQETFKEELQTGTEEVPKTREILEVYGPLNVKLPYYVKNLKDSPYLILETEEHYSLMRAIYPDKWDEIPSGVSGDGYFDRWGRMLAEGVGLSKDMITVRQVWLRPWAFNTLDREVAEKYTKLYPAGVRAVLINNKLMEVGEEKVDDHWTLSQSPVSQYIHAVPPGNDLIPIQDMTNDLANLTMETIRYAISETFADPETLDFDAYSQSEARPGQMTQAKAKAGQNLDSSFFTTKPASLSQEVEKFSKYLEQTGQFVMSSFPSIFGGPMTGGSKTLGEYEQSRKMALQRLALTWAVIVDLWTRANDKAVREFRDNMDDQEGFTKNDGEKNLNVIIRKMDTVGKIDRVEPEASEQFPISWEQLRSVLFELLSMGIEPINAAIFHPKNINFVQRLIGMTKLYVPGRDDVNNQLGEIQQLLQSVPNPDGSPSVPVNPQLDDNEIHAQITKAWLLSKEGHEASMNNPAGHANVMAHFLMHAQLAMQEVPMDLTGGGSENVEPVEGGA